ncbi:MAG: AAA family ATPase [Rhodothermales bacterium]
MGELLLKSIQPQSILSFGPETEPIELSSLNVLIGPNGSGKSNLIETIALLRSAQSRDNQRDIRGTIRAGGGIEEWIWKRKSQGEAILDAVVSNPGGTQPLRHVIAFRQVGQLFHLVDERIEYEKPFANQVDPYFFYRYQRGNPVISTKQEEKRHLQRDTVEPDLSILAQRRDPETYPVLSYLSQAYEAIRIYREWSFGRRADLRKAQQIDMPNWPLEEDFSNLGLFLNSIAEPSSVKHALLSSLQQLYEDFSDFGVRIKGGTVQLFFNEADYVIPATRLSDGTLRYLCLLAILHDPEPPPLLCIEEPELGMHPDVLPHLADLLVEASRRTQVIVTTHSDMLVDAMSEHPEAVMICEKRQEGTHISRPDPERLASWLQDYRLGELWTSGQLGGVRW